MNLGGFLQYLERNGITAEDLSKLTTPTAMDTGQIDPDQLEELRNQLLAKQLLQKMGPQFQAGQSQLGQTQPKTDSLFNTRDDNVMMWTDENGNTMSGPSRYKF